MSEFLNLEFPLQWGSGKRLRGPKIVNGGTEVLDMSGLLRKAVDRRVFRAEKQVRRPCAKDASDFIHKLAKWNSNPSTPVENGRPSCQAAKLTSVDRVQGSCLPSTHKLEETALCPSRIDEMSIPGNPTRGCSTPAAGELQEKFQHSDPLTVPKFIIELSRKEKEEDFLAFKGTKLPQRPRKRPKHIQRYLQSICPGSWLCDISLDRYEVREKNANRKRPHGLRAMCSLGSDSD
eukprot:c25165_g1_i1 orf=807-1508(+)